MRSSAMLPGTFTGIKNLILLSVIRGVVICIGRVWLIVALFKSISMIKGYLAAKVVAVKNSKIICIRIFFNLLRMSICNINTFYFIFNIQDNVFDQKLHFFQKKEVAQWQPQKNIYNKVYVIHE